MDLSLANDAITIIIAVIAAFVGSVTWTYRQTKNIAADVSQKITDGLAEKVRDNATKIDTVEAAVERLDAALKHQKANQKTEALALKKRFDKIDTEIQNLSMAYVKSTSELDHRLKSFIELTRLEARNANEGMARIEDTLRDQRKLMEKVFNRDPAKPFHTPGTD